MKIIALVPMRHHSQRVPGKNYRLLAGKPLYQHILATLQDVPEISGILVDTDSPQIQEGLSMVFPQVQVVERPAHLRADDIPMNDILIHDTGQVEADLYLQTHSTNPLLRAETISRAIHAFLDARPAYDSLFSVTRLQSRFYDQHGRALNHDPERLVQTQDLPPVFEENSCLYLFNHANLVRRHHRIGDHPLLFEIEASEAWDIDEELDFVLCDFLLAKRSG